MSRYEKYKATNIEWIGEIPEHWELKKLKYSTTINDEVLPETTDDSIEINYVEISSIQGGKIVSKQTCLFSEAPSRARRKVKDGDIIVSTVRTYLKAIARIENPEDNLIVSTGFAVIRPKEIKSTYLGNLFFSEHLIDEIISRSVGVSYPAISSSEIGDIKIPVPSPEEQTIIAYYLDEKTAQIDNLISHKQQLIKLLKEERNIIIDELIIEQGKDWRHKRLKYLAKMQGGFAFKSDDFIKEGIQLIKIGNLYQNEFSLERQPTFLPEDFLEKYPDWVVSEGDILMSMTGTLGKRDYGYAIQVPRTGKKYLLNQRVSKINFNESEILKEFGLRVLLSTQYLDQLFLLPTGTKQGNFSNEQVLSIAIKYPNTIKEQEVILSQIKKIEQKFDDTVRRIITEIELIQEYKTALISEVVAGKQKVYN